MMSKQKKSIETISFRNLSFAYDGQGSLLEKVSIDFPMNNVILLKGATGGGKNTLLKLIAGLIAPSSGQYLINNVPVQECSYSEFDPYRLSMGYSFDVGGLINNMSIYENFRLLLDFHSELSESDKKIKIIKLLDRLNIGDGTMHLRPAAVSAGTRKAAVILRSFLLDPELLILNNPTLGLNNEHLEPLISLIREHQKEKNLKHIFLSTDDPNMISAFDYVGIKVANKNLELEQKLQELKQAG